MILNGINSSLQPMSSIWACLFSSLSLVVAVDNSDSPCHGPRPFKFQAAWLWHAEFFVWMSREWEWEWEGCLTTSLRQFAVKLEAWMKSTFGHIFERKRRNLARLEGVQRALGTHYPEGLLKLERKLQGERTKILLQGELLWKQKSRCDWLMAGDRNTNFFTRPPLYAGGIIRWNPFKTREETGLRGYLR